MISRTSVFGIFVIFALAGTTPIAAQGIDEPIETRLTPTNVGAENSKQGIVITSKTASNPFTLEMIGQKIESHSSKRIVLDVDGRLIVLSFFGLQGTDIDAPQEQLLKAFEKIDTEILARQGWQVVHGSEATFTSPNTGACLYWILHATKPERHLATAVTRLGSNIIILESPTTDASTLAGLRQYLETTILTLQASSPAAPSDLQPQPEMLLKEFLAQRYFPEAGMHFVDKNFRGIERASGLARQGEILSKDPHSTLLNVDLATEADARDLGSVRLSGKELIAAAVNLLHRIRPERPGVPAILGASVFDGRYAHAINLTGYVDDTQIVKYWDPWGEGSFLAAGSNAAGVEAVPSPSEKRIWHVRRDQLERVLYALTPEFNQLLALTEDMPLHTFRGLGDRLEDAKKRDLFTHFYLDEVARAVNAGGKQAVTFRPMGSKLRDGVVVTITTSAADLILDAKLRLNRDLIESNDFSAFLAADITSNFLDASIADDDMPFLKSLLGEIMNSPAQRPPQPSMGLLTYLGKEKQFNAILTRSLLRMRNIEDGGRPILVVSVETTRRVPPKALADLNAALRAPDDIKALIAHGDSLKDKGDYELAMADYNKVLAEEPDNTVALHQRGRAYWSEDDLSEALADFDAVLRQAPEDTDMLIEHGRVLKDMGDQTRANFALASDIAPDDPDRLTEEGNVKARGYYERAIADYDKALVARPDNGFALRQRGVAHWSMGNVSEALTDLDAALKIAPNDIDTLLDHAGVLIETGDYDRAIADYDKVLTAEPNYALALSGRGMAYQRKGDLDKALADVEAALRITPDDTDILINHADILDDKGDHDGAIAEYDKVLAAKSDDANALNGRAWNYAQKGELDKALDDANRAITLEPNEPATLDTRGWIYIAQGKPELALPDLNKALSIDPEFASIYADRGRAYELKGERDKAIADYRKAVSLKSRESYDDKAKAEAERRLATLGAVEAGNDKKDIASPAPETSAKVLANPH